SYSFSSHRRWSPLNAFPELHLSFFPRVICTCENHQRKNHMKTITKLIYLAFTVVILAIGAVTANGVPNDLFVSINGDGNNGDGSIYQYTPTGVQSIFASALSEPRGIAFGLAFDGAGNLFAADAVFQTIWKFTPDGTRSVFVIPSINPDQGLVGLAFDRFGNLFASTESNLVEPDTILKFTPDGMQSTFAMNLTNPRGLAFDRSGNLFVSELAPANEILKFTPDGNQTLFASGIPTQPEFLAFWLLPTPRLTR